VVAGVPRFEILDLPPAETGPPPVERGGGPLSFGHPGCSITSHADLGSHLVWTICELVWHFHSWSAGERGLDQAIGEVIAAVETFRVDREQHSNAVPGPRCNLGGRDAAFSHVLTAVSFLVSFVPVQIRSDVPPVST
jgi:hypothetical protein